jgi:hypothetical protein
MIGQEGGHMRSILTGTLAAFALCAVVSAQAGQAQPAAGQKPAAKPHDMTGCLEKGDMPMTYRLTNVEGGKVKVVDITEVSKEVMKIDAHLGHKVTITGTALPKPAAGAKPVGEHYMRIEGFKHVSPTCP